MTELFYDLHVHSCLSPCGDENMTPANIAGMAALKGLELVALTDHNSCRNCPAFLAAARAQGIVGIPGMELTTSEVVHAVCLFPKLEQAMDFDRFVYEQLLKVKNRPEIFGKQQIYDENDSVCGEEPCLLIHASRLSFEGLWEQVSSFGGVMFPAHIDKNSNSLIANLGFIPPDSSFQTAEIKDMKKLRDLKCENPYLERCRIICNSDAHYLEHISERLWSLPVEERSPEAAVDALRRGLAGL